MTLRRILLGAALAGLMLPAAVRADGEKGKNMIKAKVTLDAEKPKAQSMSVGQDPYCEKKRQGKGVTPQGAFVGPDKSLPYAIVYVKSGVKGEYAPPADPVVIDQEGCMYKPHVLGMVAKQTIQIKNSDDTAHNIHAKPKLNTEFNISQPKKGMVATRKDKETFSKPEFVAIKCDVHSWMSCYVGVFAHPFFGVTGFDNEKKTGVPAEIKDLPDGEYEVEAWHEMWGTSDPQKVTVKGGETKEIEFVFKKKGADATPAGGMKTITPAQADGATGEAVVKTATVN